MAPDLLDDLLDRSAPPTRAVREADIDAMISDAVGEVRRRTSRRRLRLGIAAGLAAILTAGGGVAFAGGLISWAPRYESPDVSFPVTLPSGRHCEVRVISVAADDGTRTSPKADAQLRKWLSNSDLVDGLDLSAARAEDARMAAESPNQTIVIGPEGWLMDAPQAPDTRSEDDMYAHVVDIAVREAVLAEVHRLGIDVRTSTFNGGIKCEATAR